MEKSVYPTPPVEKVSSMKGITITTANRKMLATRWNISQVDLDTELPLGHILVVDFGNEGEIPYETVTQALFDETFNRLYDIENGWYAIERKEIVVPPPTTH